MHHVPVLWTELYHGFGSIASNFKMLFLGLLFSSCVTIIADKTLCVVTLWFAMYFSKVVVARILGYSYGITWIKSKVYQYTGRKGGILVGWSIRSGETKLPIPGIFWQVISFGWGCYYYMIHNFSVTIDQDLIQSIQNWFFFFK